MPLLERVNFACGHAVPEDADDQVRETAEHWLCPACTARRNGQTWHDWTEEEIFFDRRRSVEARGGSVRVCGRKWGPAGASNPTMHYQWVEIPGK
jgi:hypothetical protein